MGAGGNMAVLRVLRMARIFRIFKVRGRFVAFLRSLQPIHLWNNMRRSNVAQNTECTFARKHKPASALVCGTQ